MEAEAKPSTAPKGVGTALNSRDLVSEANGNIHPGTRTYLIRIGYHVRLFICNQRTPFGRSRINRVTDVVVFAGQVGTLLWQPLVFTHSSSSGRPFLFAISQTSVSK